MMSANYAYVCVVCAFSEEEDTSEEEEKSGDDKKKEEDSEEEEEEEEDSSESEEDALQALQQRYGKKPVEKEVIAISGSRWSIHFTLHTETK